MYLSIQVEKEDTPQSVRALSAALLAYASELEDVKTGETGATGYSDVGSCSYGPGVTGAAGNAPTVAIVDEIAEPTPTPKRTRKPAAAVAPVEVEPEPEVEDSLDDADVPADEEEPEDEPVTKPAKAAKAAPAAKANGKAAPEDKALRQEVLERFASYADEAGVLEGKALLQEFNAAKFSEVAAEDLKAFGKRLTVLEAAL